MKRMIFVTMMILLFSNVASAAPVSWGVVTAECIGCQSIETFTSLLVDVGETNSTKEFVKVRAKYLARGCAEFHVGDIIVIESYIGLFFAEIRKVKSAKSYWIVPIWIRPEQ